MSEKYYDRITTQLSRAFQPTYMEIKDNSAKHLEHAGAHPEGETHFSVKIVSAVFDGKNPIERHRLIYQALSNEIDERVHALTIEAISLQEHNLKTG